MSIKRQLLVTVPLILVCILMAVFMNLYFKERKKVVELKGHCSVLQHNIRYLQNHIWNLGENIPEWQIHPAETLARRIGKPPKKGK